MVKLYGLAVPVMNRLLQKSIPLLLLTVVVWTAFSPCLKAGFLNWDDDINLLEHPTVRSLEPSNLKRMFQESVQKIYTPLTTFSYALEYHFFGFKPFVYHLDNLFLHWANTVLVFCLALRFGFSAAGALVAALMFGVHPMRVESVAWVTERKDVLYAFFYLWAMFFYLDYLKIRRWNAYGGALVFGFLSMLAKPMAASLPLVFLLMDWHRKRQWDVKALLDKIPFFAFIIPLAWITYSLNPHVHQPGASAFLISIWSLAFYIRKFFWPDVFIPLYKLPLPVDWSTPAYPVALGLCLLVVLLAIAFRKNRWVLFAVFYFLLSIVFVLGLNPSTVLSVVDDRYMYLSNLGFCLLLGDFVSRRLVSDAASFWKMARLGILIIGVFSVLIVKTFAQSCIWQDSFKLWNYVLGQNPQSSIAYNNRGNVYNERDQLNEAMADYNKAIELNPQFARAFGNRGVVYAKAGRNREAMENLNKAIGFKPDFDKAYYNRSVIDERFGQYEDAIKDALKAQSLGVSLPEDYLSELEKKAAGLNGN